METPNWYWTKGLHDAEVINLSFEKFDYDYTQRDPIRNCLIIELDSKNAMFDTTVKTIKMYNSKIVYGDMDFIGWFWNNDVLTALRKGFELEITL